MKLAFAKTISFVLNPLTVLLFAPFLLVYRTTHDAQAAWYWTGYTLLFLVVIGLFVLTGVKKKIFIDLDVSKREQRPLLFSISLLLASLYVLGLFILDGPYILYVSIFGSIVGLAVASIINQRLKASIHVATIAAFVLPLAISFGKYYFLLLLLIPLIGWARLTTKRHSLPEVIVGGTLGGILSLSFYLTVRFFLNR